ncbi:hypothetical protein [Flavobacterium sp.]|jgi:hypothetical protein|uniref:hypothetical protein n=1 Tax=Flavobacterium sp. TaxID=239 RepID=UPI0037BF945E
MKRVIILCMAVFSTAAFAQAFCDHCFHHPETKEPANFNTAAQIDEDKAQPVSNTQALNQVEPTQKPHSELQQKQAAAGVQEL